MDISDFLHQKFGKHLGDELLELGSIIEYPENTMIHAKGKFFSSSMIILEGVVDVYREDEEGRRFLMYSLTSGEACALSMICAMKGEKSEITAYSSTPIKLLSIPIEKLSYLLKEYNRWYLFVIENYRRRMDELINVIDHIAFKALDERLAFYLSQKSNAIDNDVIEVTHKQIAEDLHSSREVISRLLKKMETEGKVQLGRNIIRVKEF